MRSRPSALVKSLKKSKATAPVAIGVASAGLAAALMVAWVRRRARRARVAAAPAPQPAVDPIDENSMQSFPASDPPSTMSPTTTMQGKRPRSS